MGTKILTLIFMLCVTSGTYGQQVTGDSCGNFTLHILVDRPASDSLQFVYSDCRGNVVGGIYPLMGGAMTISGTVNRATNGILFAHRKIKRMDGPGTIRFIIEPGVMTLRYTVDEDTAKNVVITGSPAQKEKEAWEAAEAPLLRSQEDLLAAFGHLFRRQKEDSLIYQQEMPLLGDIHDALRQVVAGDALKYAQKNPHSFLSAYFLYYYGSSIPLDSQTSCFSRLDPRVIASDIGKRALKPMLVKTRDTGFRKRFSDSAAYATFQGIKSVYDFTLPNMGGTETHFSSLRGKIVLLDFWGSWCGPCIRNIPYLKKLIRDMKGKPVDIVSVNMDDRPEVWRAAVTKYGFPGLQLFDDHKLLSAMYKVLWAPRYILLAPDGTVADADAPQATDPQLEVKLKKMIAQL